ncbi:GntR family transcriptional regulator [Phytoactinopolyspora halotolerans]|uniref:GntR family transcriptional regulator n=1 Tax=Phytoactinopolyspora halotolerans TaxID=1981512 RepID=A0A6L9SBK2_9ACTN|nr:GntR family transcriptional regulator [Phytoactinopolyspora halotolerans]NEE02507.1 GntR family transcriptional regulator [Phytoactinopolyspora halotolerans]
MTTETSNQERGLAERAYLTLRAAILEHELAPGTRLSVPNVAERLGVSRSPAREAIARITYEGLAHFEPNKGAVVADVDAASLVEIYEVREALEGLACRLASRRMSPQDVDGLRDLLAQHAAAVEAGDVETHYKLDMRFHARIRELAGNTRLTTQLELLQRQIRLAMYTTHRSPGGMPQAVTEHRRIVDALESGDPVLAEAAGRSHIGRLLRDLSAAERVG